MEGAILKKLEQTGQLIIYVVQMRGGLFGIFVSNCVFSAWKKMFFIGEFMVLTDLMFSFILVSLPFEILTV